MAKRPVTTAKQTPEAIAAKLVVLQRVLLFLRGLWHGLQEGRDQQRLGAARRHRNLVKRDEATSRLVLTDQGRAVLAALLEG